MCFLTIDDTTAVQEIMVGNELFDSVRNWLTTDQVVLIEARVMENRRAQSTEGQDDTADAGLRIIADKLMSLEEAREKFAKALQLICAHGTDVRRLLDTIRPYTPGITPIKISYRKDTAYSGELELGQEWWVTPHPQLLQKLKTFLPAEAVTIQYA
ncbi:MAG: polymerase subunit alpha, partial [Pseudomonadota bacterium]|jgi:DNA polymerase-3 subunit alpha